MFAKASETKRRSYVRADPLGWTLMSRGFDIRATRVANMATS